MMSRALRASLLTVVTLTSSATFADEADVASAFSKAAKYVYNRDFIHEPVDDEFSLKELSALKAHLPELRAMIQDAFINGHSVGGARLTGYFAIEENLPILQDRLSVPGVPYGWEGPDYSDEETYLADNQFVFHRVYLEAIEETSKLPIHEAISPTDRQLGEWSRRLNDVTGRQYYWSKWLSRKLLLTPPAK